MSHSNTRISSYAHDRQRGVVMHMEKNHWGLKFLYGKLAGVQARTTVKETVRECATSLQWGWQERHNPNSRGQGSFGSQRTHVTILILLIQRPQWDYTSHTYLTSSDCSQLTVYIMSYPWIISLHSARMKCSFSGVKMHSEFFWPVLDSPSMTSEHWFMLIVPCGRVVGCRTQ